jgi:hypothetical protein
MLLIALQVSQKTGNAYEVARVFCIRSGSGEPSLFHRVIKTKDVAVYNS